MSIISKVRSLLLLGTDPAGARRSRADLEQLHQQAHEREAREADLLHRILRADQVSTPTTYDLPDIPNQKKATAMTDISEFEIPSAIMAAALVEKSELKGQDLEAYAIRIQRMLINRMMAFRKKKESESSETDSE